MTSEKRPRFVLLTTRSSEKLTRTIKGKKRITIGRFKTKKLRLGTIFRIRTKDVGMIIVVRRISPSSRALAVDYAVKVIRGDKSFVVGIKDNKFDAKDLARKTRQRLNIEKRARELAIRAGVLAKRGGQLGLGLALRVGRIIEKATRSRRKSKKKKPKKRKKK